MRQDISKATQSNLKKRYQISFRRWVVNESGGGPVARFIGADRSFVRQWIQQRFLSPMTWSNYGDIWVIDHIVPLRLFDVSVDAELKICFHYKNIMPLFKADNLYKEGALDFSIRALEKVESCEITEKLKERLLAEIGRMDKYIRV